MLWILLLTYLPVYLQVSLGSRQEPPPPKGEEESLETLQAQLKQLESQKDQLENGTLDISNFKLPKDLPKDAIKDLKPPEGVAPVTLASVSSLAQSVGSSMTPDIQVPDSMRGDRSDKNDRKEKSRGERKEESKEESKDDGYDDHTLIALLKNKNIYSNLPLEVRNLLKNYKIQSNITNLDPYFEANNATLTPNSLPLIDSSGKLGRKGYLRYIKNNSSQSVWVVQNAKVFCVYENEEDLSILTLIRNSMVRVEDLLATPCFVVYGEKEVQERFMFCAPSIGEKELWIQEIQSWEKML